MGASAFVLLALILASCAGPGDSHTRAGGSAAIAMPDRFAAQAATEILERGGNAVDAAVAAAFTLAVTYPEAGNIGGGGFMLIQFGGESGFVDYREVAPAAASKDMYLDADGEVIPGLSLTGPLASGVPGTVAGLAAAHARYGLLEWTELLQPAIRLAGDGFPIPATLVARIAEAQDTYEGHTNFREYFGAAKPGELFIQPELAATLTRIAEFGADGFYKGVTAKLIADSMEVGAGLITEADLSAYRVVWREPLKSPWRNYEIMSAPPPSSGGFAVIQLLKMKGYLAREFEGVSHNSPQYLHLVAEMEKRVFADRAEYFGDPDFVSVPIEELIDDDYIESRAAEVNPVHQSSVADVEPGLGPESRHTTHFSILDKWGNAVANTYTLNTWFGSGVVVPGGGFLLNNEMDDFSAKPNVPNFFGVVGGSANAIAPGKRMLSSMSPTILLEDEKPVMVIGSPGGSTIFTSVFQVIVNILDFNMSPAEAVAATRFHHQLLPHDLIIYSPGFPLGEETVRSLAERDYRVVPSDWEFGDVQVILKDGAGYSAGSDPRGRGVSIVIEN